MKIAVLSGKGGTGKTFIAVNLADVINNSVYIDCDVEEPNGYLFFKPNKVNSSDVFINVPQVDNNLCVGCRKCINFCKFNALVQIVNKILIFNNVCHSCGGCSIICPKNAITEKQKLIGKIEVGYSNDVMIKTGVLNIGEVANIKIINDLLTNLNPNNIIIIDCPPGSSCSVMESIKDVDYCILVAEPTIFGLHNLELVYDLVQKFKKPFGVIINKVSKDKNIVDTFCEEKQITILERIEYDNHLGRLISEGEIVSRKLIKYQKLFQDLLNKVKEEVENEAAINP